MPTITAIVPHKDVNELLPRAIASIKSQEVDTEIIVIDNGSKIPPVADARIILNGRDMGLPYSMNLGYREATSPLCTMVCADDELELDWFRTAIEMFERHPEIQFVSPNSKGPLRWPDILEENNQHMAAVFRRELILENPYREVALYDWDLWCRLARKGTKGIAFSTHYYNWYWREGSLRTMCSKVEDYERLSSELRERILRE